MRVTLKATRVYATKDQFGDEPRLEAQGSPISVSYSNGDRGVVILGPAPEWAYEARRVTTALGSLCLQAMFHGQVTTPEDRPQRMREVMAEVESQHRREIEDFNFFTTIVVERDIVVPADQVGPDEFIWLDPRRSQDVISAFEQEAKTPLDYMALAISLRLSGTLPGRELVFDRTYITGAGRTGFAVPRIRGSAAGMVVSSQDRLSAANLQEALDLTAASVTMQSSLPDPAHWYLAARAESDPWKRFLWAFFALERLINDSFDAAKQLPNYSQLRANAFKIDPKLAKSSLRFRLAVITSEHSPTTAANDVAALKTLTDARGAAAHGKITAPDKLPTQAVLDLLEHYLRATIGL